MITEVILPILGQTMEEGTIVEWVKQEGDPVKRGDLLFTVESDKAVLEVEATARGFLRKILVPAGQTVAVLTVVAIMTRKADEDILGYDGRRTQAARKPLDRAEARDASPEQVVGAPGAVRPRDGRIVASPRALKTAREKGVDLALVTGTGPNGRIVEEDVKLYLESRPKASPLAIKAAEAAGVDLATVTGTGVSGRIMRADVETAVQKRAAIPAEALIAESVPLTGLRRIIGERMAASHTQTARVTLITEADATASVDAREYLRTTVTEEWGFAPGYNDLLGLVVARALREFPYMNARLSSDGQSIEQLPYVNLGVAVDTERGLVVPVIRDADQKGLRDFGTEFRTLAERARAGRSLPDDLTGGTFTMTNLGMYEVDAFTPIINLPEAAILGVGRIKTRPVAVNGEVCARQTMWLSLTFDHRLVDGAPAARFFQRIKQLIENPILLLEKVAESGR